MKTEMTSYAAQQSKDHRNQQIQRLDYDELIQAWEARQGSSDSSMNFEATSNTDPLDPITIVDTFTGWDPYWNWNDFYTMAYVNMDPAAYIAMGTYLQSREALADLTSGIFTFPAALSKLAFMGSMYTCIRYDYDYYGTWGDHARAMIDSTGGGYLISPTIDYTGNTIWEIPAAMAHFAFGNGATKSINISALPLPTSPESIGAKATPTSNSTPLIDWALANATPGIHQYDSGYYGYTIPLTDNNGDIIPTGGFIGGLSLRAQGTLNFSADGHYVMEGFIEAAPDIYDANARDGRTLFGDMWTGFLDVIGGTPFQIDIVGTIPFRFEGVHP